MCGCGFILQFVEEKKNMLRILGIVSLGLLSVLCKANVLFSVPVSVDGVERKMDLLEGQTVEMAAQMFVRNIGLTQNGQELQNTIMQLSNMLAERVNAAGNQKPQPVLTVPLNVEGQEFVLDMYDGDSVAGAIENFFAKYNVKREFHREMAAKMEPIVEQRVLAFNAKNKPPAFTLPLTLGKDQFEIRHFDGLNAFDEAREFCVEQRINPDLHQTIVPQIAEAIENRIKEINFEALHGNLTPILRLPLTIEGQEFELYHYRELTPLESSVRFLTKYGVNDAASQQKYVNDLVNIIQQQLQGAEPAGEPPVLSIPLVVGQQETVLRYYSGETPEESAVSFAEKHGLRNDPSFQSYVAQLSTLIRQQLEERNISVPMQDQKVVEKEPLFSLPIALNNTVYDLHYFQDEQPNEAAIAFCNKNANSITDSSAEATVDAQLNECANFMAETITSVLAKLNGEAANDTKSDLKDETKASETTSASMEDETKASDTTSASMEDKTMLDESATIPENATVHEKEENLVIATETEAGETESVETIPNVEEDFDLELLFTLDVTMKDGSTRQLPFYAGNEPEQVAANFVQETQGEQEMVKTIVEQLQTKIAEL